MADGAGEQADLDHFEHPFDPAIWQAPQPAYRWLREHEPLFADSASHMTFVVRHADCDALLRDRAASAALGQEMRRRGEPLPRTMLNTDPPEHEELRAPAMRLLGPHVATALRPVLSARIDELLDRTAGRGEVDGIADVGLPFATGVLGVLLDVPESRWDEFSELAQAASINLDPLAGPAQIAAAGQASGRLTALLRAQAEGDDGRDTPLARFWRTEHLDEAQRLATLMLVVVGGFEPLAHLAATGSHYLARAGDLRHAVAADADAASAFVDEVLRLESPIPFVARRATADLALPNGTLPAGVNALALFGAANRDPEVFPDPDEPRLDRASNLHLGFGAGVHYCPGAPLVRTAGALLFGALARRYPELAPAGDAPPRWRASMVPRGMVDVPLRLGPARA